MTTYYQNHEYCARASEDCGIGVAKVANCVQPRIHQNAQSYHSVLVQPQKQSLRLQLQQQPQFHQLHHHHHHFPSHSHQQHHQQHLPHHHHLPCQPQPAQSSQQQTPLGFHPHYSSCTLPASTKSRHKFTNLSVKKSQTKSKAKVRASASAWWLENSCGTIPLEKVCVLGVIVW